MSKKKRNLELKVKDVESLLAMLGVDIKSLKLPYIGDCSEKVHYNTWFEDLSIVPFRKDGELWVKMIGKYAVQCRTSYKDGGIWRPSKPEYIPVNLEKLISKEK